MKITFLLTLFLASATALFAYPSEDLSFKSDDDVIEIDVNYTPPFTGPKRSPALVPICATYYPSLSYIELSFIYYIGDVEISITELTSGANQSYCFSSSYGSAIIPFCYTSGIFYIEFTSSLGLSFSGYLVL
jgi:hypothetical protein